LSKALTLEVKGLYERTKARYPDESDLYGSALSYRQESVLVPVNLMFTVAEQGLGAYLGFGGYYGYILNAEVQDRPSMAVDRNQWGVSWSAGLRLGKIMISGESRFQLNPLFVGQPVAKLRTGTFNVCYFF
jgi:hypothetical protein